MNKKQLTLSHTVSGSSKLLVVYGESKPNAITAITFDNAEVPVVVREKRLVFNWKFPFIHRREFVIGIKEDN